MSFRPRAALALLLVSLACLSVPKARAESREERAPRAETLYRRALELDRQNTADARRLALEDFDQATRLAPERIELWMAFGVACLQAGRLEQGRSCFSRAARLAKASDFDPWYQLGLAWKRDWLSSLDRASLDQALDCFSRACVAAPDRAEGWTAKSAIALLRGHTRDALVAAMGARRADPEAAQPLLVFGAALYRVGALPFADSAFRAARPRLGPGLRTRFDRGVPSSDLRQAVAAMHNGATADVDDRDAENTWDDLDPDLTTPENEARLDYWTRFTLAVFLFGDGDTISWDQRAELLIRYGLPSSIEFNPAAAQLGENELEFYYPRPAGVAYAPAPAGFPFNMQIWHYPDLGMDVTLWDRFLVQSYDLPYSNRETLNPRPDPRVLAQRSDLVAAAHGSAVFHATAPGAHPLTVAGSAFRFPEASGTRLVAHVFAPRVPPDSLVGAWALARSDGRVVARGTRPLSTSECDPAHAGSAQFASNVLAGRYRLDLSVRGPDRQRGLSRLIVDVLPDSGDLRIGDLVLVCEGSSRTVQEPPGVRLEPKRDERFSGSDALTVYYELEHLATDPEGNARFTYTYSIDPVPPPPGSADHGSRFSASRDEEQAGSHRRQFVHVPIAPLPPGSYELRIAVLDHVSGQRVENAVRFVKEDGKKRPRS